MNDTNKKINIEMEIEKGKSCLKQADILFKNDEYDGAVSRAYYAIFHHASAMVLTKGIEARSHEGLVRLFNLHFIKTGVLSKQYSTILSHAQKAREEADYWPEIPFTKEDAVLRLKEAFDFIKAIDHFLAHK